MNFIDTLLYCSKKEVEKYLNKPGVYIPNDALLKFSYHTDGDHLDIAEKLLKRTNDITYINSALYYAIRKKNINIVKIILQDNRVNVKTYHIANAYNSSSEILKEIFKYSHFNPIEWIEYICFSNIKYDVVDYMLSIPCVRNYEKLYKYEKVYNYHKIFLLYQALINLINVPEELVDIIIEYTFYMTSRE
jgi:hypothetical protein